jgi:hypothetical protein
MPTVLTTSSSKTVSYQQNYQQNQTTIRLQKTDHACNLCFKLNFSGSVQYILQGVQISILVPQCYAIAFHHRQ